MTPKAYVKELELAGISVDSLGIDRKIPNPLPILHLARLIQTWQPDIVHSHMVHANILARLVRILAPIPILICTAHSTEEGGRFRELLYRLTDPLCDITTQVSRAGLERYVRIGAVPRRKIRYMPNGVDTKCFCPNPADRRHFRERLGLRTEFVLLAVGRIDIPKDFPNMLQAFARVATDRPETLLFIAGDGPLRPAMEELAQSLGLKGRVKFLGIRRDIPELMNAADGYVMSSAWEGLPNVLLEASATGLPIIATDVGGNRDVVLDFETGFLVTPKNPEALAETMVHLMELTDVERRLIGEAGRHYIEANYSLERVVDMWETLYWEYLRKST
jgi:glycosyltransferase involved in cell wall biosynthesis